MAGETVITRVSELAQPLIDEQGLELVDVEYHTGGGAVLRLFIDKPGGVNLDDCAAFSRELGLILDVEEVISGEYRLEISSPGLDRIIKKDSDFARFAGEMVRVKTTLPLDPDGRGYLRKTFIGILRGLENDAVVVELQEPPPSEVALARNVIERVNLEPQF